MPGDVQRAGSAGRKGQIDNWTRWWNEKSGRMEHQSALEPSVCRVGEEGTAKEQKSGEDRLL